MKRPPLGARCCRVLLRLLPPSSREYEREIMATVVARHRRRRRSSKPARIAWTRAWLGLLGAVARAWTDDFHDARRGAQRRPRAALRALPPPGGGTTNRLRFESRTALRALRRSPTFTVAAVLSLAIGIGANAGTGSIAWQIIAAPLPFPDQQELLQIYQNGDLTEGIALANVPRFAAARALTGAAGWRTGEITFHPEGLPAERVPHAAVTANLFSVLRAAPFLGATFDQEAPANGVILSHRFWRSRLDGDPAAVGRTLRFSESPFTVVGVLGPEFVLRDAEIAVFVLLPQAPGDAGDGPFVDVVGRLRADATLAAASAEVDALARELSRRQTPDAGPGPAGGHARRLGEAWRGDDAEVWLALATASVMLLLATSANVTLLMVSRRIQRRGELRVRYALGASRTDLMRAQAIESFLLAGLAGVAGGLIGWTIVRGTAMFAAQAGAADAATTNALPPLLWITAVATVGSALIISAVTLPGVVHQARRGGGASRWLVPVQVAIALTLLSGSSLQLRTVRNLLQVDLGYRVAQVAAGRVTLPPERYGEPEQQAAFFGELTAAMRRRGAPQLDVGLVNSLPLSAFGGAGDVIVEGADPDAAVPVVAQRLIDPGYLATMGIPIVAGRTFDERDRDGAPRVAIVDAEFARRHLGGAAQALGARLRFFMGGEDWNEVVGVVGAIRPGGPRDEDVPMVYVPIAQRPSRSAHVVMSGAAETAQAGRILRQQVRELDPEIPVSDLRSLAARFDGTLMRPRIMLGIFGLFAGFTVLLAAVGSYAMSALEHESRLRELGIRKALGARPAQVAAVVTAGGVRSYALGVVVGIIGSLAVGQALQSFLFGVSAADPLSLATATGVLTITTGLAMLPSLRRGLRADPRTALDPH